MKEIGIDENNNEFIQRLSNELSNSKSLWCKNAETSADSAEPRVETDNLVPFSQYISKSLE